MIRDAQLRLSIITRDDFCTLGAPMNKRQSIASTVTHDSWRNLNSMLLGFWLCIDCERMNGLSSTVLWTLIACTSISAEEHTRAIQRRGYQFILFKVSRGHFNLLPWRLNSSTIPTDTLG
jgi:hypothetical protein